MTNYTSNPVGSLQERFQSHGTKPHYKLVKASGSAHDPTFSCQVTVRNQVSMGKGSSKKQAKNAAALAMLDKLDKMDPANEKTQARLVPVNGKIQDRLDDLAPVNEKTPARLNKMVPAVVLANAKSQARLNHMVPANEKTSSLLNKVVPAAGNSKTIQDYMVLVNENNETKDSASVNSVGTLHEMCVRLGYRHPEYDLEGLDGQPQVGISILCSVGDLKQRGTGPSKDEAKIEAAQKMVDLLRSLMPNSFSSSSSIDQTQQDDLSDKLDSLNIVTSKIVNGLSSKMTNGVSSKVVNDMSSKMVTNMSSKTVNVNSGSSKIVNSVSSEMNIMSSKMVNSVSSKMVNDNNVSSNMNSNIVESGNNQLTPSASVKLDSLHKTCLKEKTRDYITMLKELGKEQKFVVTHVEERSEDYIQCLVQLSTVPVAVSYAIGTDSNTIHNEAARDILIYLKMLTKQSSK